MDGLYSTFQTKRKKIGLSLALSFPFFISGYYSGGRTDVLMTNVTILENWQYFGYFRFCFPLSKHLVSYLALFWFCALSRKRYLALVNEYLFFAGNSRMRYLAFVNNDIFFMAGNLGMDC